MTSHQPAPKRGFTLVELMVAVTIIGILMAIAIPAIGIAMRRARESGIRTEVESIAQAVEAYKLRYGDYPPDFVNWNVVVRHYRKVFPDIATTEILALSALTHVNGAFDPTAIDRAEAIVWNLGGFSSDPQRPFTGSGGPLLFFGTDAQVGNPNYYSYNVSRDNPLLDMSIQNLTIRPIDENAPFPSTTNRRLSSDDGDVFPVYIAPSARSPFVYFDSRTYSDFAIIGGSPVFNGFANEVSGGVVTDGVRPMFSTMATPENLLGATPGDIGSSIKKSLSGLQFMNPNTFQIFCAGLDGRFGSVVTIQTQDGPSPVYFQYPTGRAVMGRGFQPGMTVSSLYVPNVRGFQDTSFQGVATLENHALDNITNFSSSTLEGDVQE